MTAFGRRGKAPIHWVRSERDKTGRGEPRDCVTAKPVNVLGSPERWHEEPFLAGTFDVWQVSAVRNFQTFAASAQMSGSMNRSTNSLFCQWHKS